MNLTNEDLFAISELLDEKLKSELQPVKEDIAELKTDVSQLKTDVAGLKTDVSQLKTDVAGLKTDVSQLKTDVAGFKTEIPSLKEEIKKLKLNQENIIMPQIRILAENYIPAAKRYEIAISQIDTMQADIDTLKHVVSEHSEKLKNLA